MTAAMETRLTMAPLFAVMATCTPITAMSTVVAVQRLTALKNSFVAITNCTPTTATTMHAATPCHTTRKNPFAALVNWLITMALNFAVLISFTSTITHLIRAAIIQRPITTRSSTVVELEDQQHITLAILPAKVSNGVLDTGHLSRLF